MFIETKENLEHFNSWKYFTQRKVATTQGRYLLQTSSKTIGRHGYGRRKSEEKENEMLLKSFAR